jgi:hypothetical protein
LIEKGGQSTTKRGFWPRASAYGLGDLLGAGLRERIWTIVKGVKEKFARGFIVRGEDFCKNLISNVGAEANLEVKIGEREDLIYETEPLKDSDGDRPELEWWNRLNWS